MDKLYNISAPIARFFLTAIFIQSGLGKITAYAATQGYMEMMGVPSFLLPLVIALELLGGIAVLVGFKARWAALLIAGFSLMSALLFHPYSDPEQQLHFMKNLTMAGGFLMVFIFGPGAYSIDNHSQHHNQ